MLSTTPVDDLADDRLAAVDVSCMGCRGLVPDVDGPRHQYMRASPGCWQVYNELIADTLTESGAPIGRWHHVDCFAVQHPGGAQLDRRQRQSVAVHLISLCLLHEFGQPPERASARRGRTSRQILARVGLSDWPFLLPPSDLGAVTARDVQAVAVSDRAERMQDRAKVAWTAWASHHAAVRLWAAAAWEQGR